MTTKPVRLDLKISRTSATPLPQQLADAIRAAVASGQYRPGDRLPSLKELAVQAETSLRVPREAVRLLADEGVVTTSRGFGTVVSKRSKAAAGKHVLIVHPNGYGAYYLGSLVEEIGRKLRSDGHLVVSIAVFRDERGQRDLNGLKKTLRQWRFDAVLAFAYDDTIFSILSEMGTVYVACTFRPMKYPGAAGRINCSHNFAIPELVAHCRERRIRHVWQVTYGPFMPDIGLHLSQCGIRTETIRIAPPLSDFGKQEYVECQAHALLGRKLDTDKMPDLILILDDFAARGGILALAERGIRYPQDVKLAVWSNRLFTPAAACPLTRMEMNPYEHGKIIADAFRSFLKTGKLPTDIRIGPAYVKAESFS